MAIDEKFAHEHEHDHDHDHDHDIDTLIEVGKEKGYLTYGDVNEMLPDEMASSPDDLDDLITTIGTQGIDLLDGPKVRRQGLRAGKRARMSSSDLTLGTLEKTNDPVGVAAARGRFAYQSQHLGDLENLTGLEFFRESLDHLMRTFEIEPQTVVHDLHPGYLSTQWAKDWASERGLPLIAVQHHHAHIAGCMAEHGLEGPVIGLALDGTGYGSDGKIWGGEVLIARLGSFERFAHLEYVAMPGGEKAIREPWRMAFAALRVAGFDVEPAAALSGASGQEARVLERMIERGVNAPLTSSLGRLFDAVAAVVLSRRVVDYEAQAAIELEGVAIDEPDDEPGYAMEFIGGDWSARQPVRISAAPLWRGLVEELRDGANRAKIAARFHAGVAAGFARAAVLARTATGVKQVALSGGCMHNRRLARLLRVKLETEGFEVFQHKHVSPGDGGLSYGQIAVAAAMLTSRS